MDDYITVRVPKPLKKLFEDTQNELQLGYTSFAEFVKEAIRLRIEELRQNYMME